ncbi:MAG: aquaporin, partial [Microvirga sp.]
RSFGPALVLRGDALAQVWLFLIAPMIGGALAGVVDKMTEAAHARRAKPGFV